MTVPFVHEDSVTYGTATEVSPLVRRVVADNPSGFTYHGTGTYIIGRGEVAVVDAGPAIPRHVDAILAATAGETITHQLVTHTHSDHSPAAALIRQATGAETWAFGPHGSGRAEGEVAVEEGGDRDFRPDHKVRHGDVIEGAGWTVECVFTPGHTSNHMCFCLRDETTLFSGDHVMGWSTTVVSPPDGDMAAYMRSLRVLLERDDTIYLPTHGPAITDPKTHVTALIAHREAREEQIVACLEDGITTIPEMVERMYAAVDRSLHPAARQSVLAHIIHMVETERLTTEGPPSVHGICRLARSGAHPVGTALHLKTRSIVTRSD
ncbi:MAG: MBL fold metallo-hydrolase [Rhodospirillales bacterium]|nr:MBL fold metallo-hydrolase [Rhodospirillales bacterium]